MNTWGLSMFEIRSLAAPSAPAPIEADPPPRRPTGGREPESAPLDDAVTLDLSPEAKRALAEAPPEPSPDAGRSEVRYRRDVETQQMVFQVLDPNSGSVLDQLPSESALRAKTYARESEAAQAAPIGTTVARTA
ncbi:conserved hypothetical protein [Methylobacterium sp. 4-46]|uniref:flagellar protein FlaG n=1 Tax=unclassified Methylobacterium TaxID=2615210 RepID=UPI000165C5A5|nr:MULTISPECIES: flagellar protein FlaG [Methylobacterium]ACA17667.1 conserved hypothetical protein [Methylobacterium sp. 4-46]WFT83337.1 flagellar protein FlaG [Methylobacterium nodulans]